MRKWYILFPALLIICVSAIYIFYPTDENRIRKIISNSEKAFISEDADRLMEFISYNYMDDYGNSYLKLKKTLQFAFKQMDNIDIERNIIKISIDGSLAEAELSVRVLASMGEERGYIIGDAGEAREIKVFFGKPTNKWLITKVEGEFDKDGLYY